jgi:hypothetical protein
LLSAGVDIAERGRDGGREGGKAGWWGREGERERGREKVEIRENASEKRVCACARARADVTEVILHGDSLTSIRHVYLSIYIYIYIMAQANFRGDFNQTAETAADEED